MASKRSRVCDESPNLCYDQPFYLVIKSGFVTISFEVIGVSILEVKYLPDAD